MRLVVLALLVAACFAAEDSSFNANKQDFNVVMEKPQMGYYQPPPASVITVAQPVAMPTTKQYYADTPSQTVEASSFDSSHIPRATVVASSSHSPVIGISEVYSEIGSHSTKSHGGYFTTASTIDTATGKTEDETLREEMNHLLNTISMQAPVIPMAPSGNDAKDIETLQSYQSSMREFEKQENALIKMINDYAKELKDVATKHGEMVKQNAKHLKDVDTRIAKIEREIKRQQAEQELNQLLDVMKQHESEMKRLLSMEKEKEKSLSGIKRKMRELKDQLKKDIYSDAAPQPTRGMKLETESAIEAVMPRMAKRTVISIHQPAIQEIRQIQAIAQKAGPTAIVSAEDEEAEEFSSASGPEGELDDLIEAE